MKINSGFIENQIGENMTGIFKLYNVTTDEVLSFDRNGLNPVQALRYAAFEDSLKNAYLESVKIGIAAESNFLTKHPKEIKVGLVALFCDDWSFHLKNSFNRTNLIGGNYEYITNCN